VGVGGGGGRWWGLPPERGGSDTTPLHNIRSTAPQLSISQKALGTLPDDVNVMP
jgi:hypothetical protein